MITKGRKVYHIKSVMSSVAEYHATRLLLTQGGGGGRGLDRILGPARKCELHRRGQISIGGTKR